MPLPNEHSCRLRQPGDFQKDSFRRTARKHKGKTYDVISGKLKGEDSMTEQAYRYPKDTWSAADARSHCDSHDGISFEPAAEDESAAGEEIERRILTLEQGEIRAETGETPHLKGYAAKFGILTDMGWFKEKIKAGAFDEVLKDSDARALKNHDPNLLLGRESSGTLRLESNSVGLKFEIDVPDTTTGRDTLEEVRRGDLAGCSFGFTVSEDAWMHKEGEKSERTILRIDRLFDVGPVTFPAYEDTTVVARSVQVLHDQRQIAASESDLVERVTQDTAPAVKAANPAEVAKLRREIAIIKEFARSPKV
jgi:HK97 family phage prohead protease